ncbi:MAG: phosphoribosylanthranilate isomerase [Bacillota bacterium]
MIVQIYSLTHPDDVRACVDLGVDHLGFAVGKQGVPAEVTFQQARELFALIPPRVKKLALTVWTDPERIIDMVHQVRPDILHISADTDAVDVAAMKKIRAGIGPEVRIMKAIEVADRSAIDAARRYEAVSDYLLLDTKTAEIPGVGASGKTHDWNISRELVQSVRKPVILAGGLSPDNVAEAIRLVRPAGVDTYTKTSRSAERKDMALVARFAQNARDALKE